MSTKKGGGLGGQFHLEVLGGGKGTRRTGRRGSKSGPHQTLGDHRHRGRSASPGVPARKEVCRRVQARPRRGNGEEAAGDEAVLAAHHRQTLAGVSRYWTEGEGTGEIGEREEASLYRPWISRRRDGARSFTVPARARASHPPPAEIAGLAPRGAELPSYADFSRTRAARWRGWFWPPQAGPGETKVEPNTGLGSRERS